MLNLADKSPSPQLYGSVGPCTVRNSRVGEQVLKREISKTYFNQPASSMAFKLLPVAWQRAFNV
jgi:hypothetical protein